MEVAILSGLVGLGYLYNESNKGNDPINTSVQNEASTPNGDNIYNSEFYNEADKVIRTLAKDNFESSHEEGSNIINTQKIDRIGSDLYNPPLNDKSNLSVGLKLSGNDHNINLSELQYDNLSDPNAQVKESYFITNIGFGLYYYTDNLYLVFSVPYFFQPNKINKQRHLYFSGGYKKSLGSKFKINPNFLIKKPKNSPTSISLSSILFYNETFWIGANFGSSNKNFTSPKITGGDISFMTGFKISSSLTLGYSYTSPIGEWTSSYNSNSHEIFIKIKTINSLKKSSEESNTEEIPKEKN